MQIMLIKFCTNTISQNGPMQDNWSLFVVTPGVQLPLLRVCASCCTLYILYKYYKLLVWCLVSGDTYQVYCKHALVHQWIIAGKTLEIALAVWQVQAKLQQLLQRGSVRELSPHPAKYPNSQSPCYTVNKLYQYLIFSYQTA